MCISVCMQSDSPLLLALSHDTLYIENSLEMGRRADYEEEEEKGRRGQL